MNRNSIKVWLEQIRAPFLLLSVLLVSIGGAAAYRDGTFYWFRLVLTIVGVVLAHIAVNLFNELSDHKTGIDNHTKRTPFSGGSGSLQAGNTTPHSVRNVAIITLLAALGIGLFLIRESGWLLIAFMIIGGIAAVFYTSHLARWMIGEIAAGVSLGTLVVLGTYYSQTGLLTPSVVWLSVPPGILTALLLLLNEFPDIEADRRGGRRHLVIILGLKGAAKLYMICIALSYLLLITGALTGHFPKMVLLTLLTIPLAVKASVNALRHGANQEKLIPALGANVGVVLGTDFLIAVAFLIP